MSELIRKQDALDALGEEPPVWYDSEDEIAERNQWRRDVKAIEGVPTAQQEQDREFIKLTVRNSNGKPYYSIIYLEFDNKGVEHDFEGYSSYSLDVISDYLKKYFMPSAHPEPKKGKWLSHYDYCEKHGYVPSGLIAFWWCDQCEQGVEHPTNFCPNCGARMKDERK